MRRPARQEMGARFGQAEVAIHRQPDRRGIGVVLTVVFPPAHGAQLKALRRRQGPVSTAGAAKSRLHVEMDAILELRITALERERMYPATAQFSSMERNLPR